MIKLFVLLVLCGIGYIALNVLVFWINAQAKERRKTKVKVKTPNLKEKAPEGKINYDTVMANANKPKEYEKAKELFNCCIKNKLMTREQILYLKFMINDCIPAEHMRLYKIKYNNDAHEIYCKMKSSFIDEGTYYKIVEYLTMIQTK